MVLHGGRLSSSRTLIAAPVSRLRILSPVILVLQSRCCPLHSTTAIFFVIVLPSWMDTTVSFPTIRVAMSCKQASRQHCLCTTFRAQLLSRCGAYRQSWFHAWLPHSNAQTQTQQYLPVLHGVLSSVSSWSSSVQVQLHSSSSSLFSSASFSQAC